MLQTEKVPDDVQKKAEGYKQMLLNLNKDFHSKLRESKDRRVQRQRELRSQGLSEDEIREKMEQEDSKESQFR